MKRLGISLLRLGDIFMLAPALQALKQKYPEDEIHLLINENFAHVNPLLPFVDNFHLFPRKALQNDLGDPEAPILRAYDKLDQFVRELSRQGFDEVINFTHNNISACITSLLETDCRKGLQLDEQGNMKIDGEWFQILNQPAEKMPWHYSEVYLRAVGEEHYLAPTFPVSHVSQDSRLLLQPFTSEERKTWSPKYWRQYLVPLMDDFEFCEILAAPFEKQQAESFLKQLNLGDRVQLHLCDLEQALFRIRQSRLLITVDTSIKHLAAGTGIGIIELALGGSRAEHTGAFRENVLVLSCQESQPPSTGMTEVTRKYMTGQNNLSDGGDVDWGKWSGFVSRITDSGSWMLQSITNENQSKALDDVNRFMEIGFLQDEQGQNLGSSAYNCVEALRVRLTPVQWRQLASQLKAKEAECEESLDRIRGMGVEMRREISQSNVVDYSKFQTFSKCVGKLKRKQEYNRRFLRTVKLHMTETP